MSTAALRRTLFVAATFLYWVALYLYVPTLPAYVATKTVNLAAVGTVLSMYGLWQALVRIPVGIGVDAVGRGKLFIIGGFGFAAAGALVMGLGDTLPAMTLGRSLTGFAAATWVPLIAVFSGLYPPEKAVVATSLITFSASLARMIATSLNGFLNTIGGYPLAFLFAAAAAAVASLLIGFTPIEKPKQVGVTVGDVGRLFARFDVLIPSAMSLVAQIGNWAVTFGFLPLLVEQLGGGDVAKSLLIALNLLALTSANLLNTVVAGRIRRHRLLAVTILTFCAAIVLLSRARELWFLYAAAALMGFANGFTYPTLMGMSIEGVEQSRRSSAMGIHQSVYAIGMFAGPWLGGIFADAYGIRLMFAVVSLFILVTNYALLAVWIRTVYRRSTVPSASHRRRT